MCDLHGKMTSKGQLTGPMGEGDLAGAIQSPSVLGWVKQHMGTLSHNLVQRVYSKFTTQIFKYSNIPKGVDHCIARTVPLMSMSGLA